jgi:hypothetical protein
MKMRASCSLLPQRMTVATDQVHVWHGPLDISPSEVAVSRRLSHWVNSLAPRDFGSFAAAG